MCAGQGSIRVHEEGVKAVVEALKENGSVQLLNLVKCISCFVSWCHCDLYIED